MTQITDEYMHDMLAKSRTYTAVLLKATSDPLTPETRAIVWEHGRRNLELRADGVLSIVCPMTDDTAWAGIAIFNATPEEVVGIMDDDPAVKADIFTYEVHPVRGFPGDSLPG